MNTNLIYFFSFLFLAYFIANTLFFGNKTFEKFEEICENDNNISIISNKLDLLNNEISGSNNTLIEINNKIDEIKNTVKQFNRRSQKYQEQANKFTESQNIENAKNNKLHEKIKINDTLLQNKFEQFTDFNNYINILDNMGIF